MFLKNFTASVTDISNTSDIDFPLKSISNVSRLYLRPWHSSQSTSTSGRKFISITRLPAPPQVSHLPPFTLNENLPILYPRILASG